MMGYLKRNFQNLVDDYEYLEQNSDDYSDEEFDHAAHIILERLQVIEKNLAKYESEINALEDKLFPMDIA